MLLRRFKLVLYVPRDNTKAVLEHLFRKFPEDLGKIGNYEQCAFVQQGTGQFKPLENANPAIGSINNITYVEEDKVEITMVDKKGCGQVVKDAVKELKSIHPYEQVAYDVYRLEDF